MAFAATGLAWLVAASVGLAAIRRGRVALHARWMLRAYLVTLAPVLFRLVLAAAVGAGVAPSPGLVAGLLWSSWVVPLSLHALGVRAIKRWQGRRRAPDAAPQGSAFGAGARRDPVQEASAVPAALSGMAPARSTPARRGGRPGSC